MKKAQEGERDTHSEAVTDSDTNRDSNRECDNNCKHGAIFGDRDRAKDEDRAVV